jgi:hypothetical protein
MILNLIKLFNIILYFVFGYNAIIIYLLMDLAQCIVIFETSKIYLRLYM